MKENEKKFRGHFFSPLRTVGNPKSFLGEKKKKEKLTLFYHLRILLQNKTSTMKKIYSIYIHTHIYIYIICMYFWRRVLNTYFSGVAEDYFLVWYDATCFHFLFSWTIVTLQYVLVSAIHQHESVIGIYMSPPSWTFLPSPSPSYHPSRFSQSTRFGFLAFYHLNTLDLLWCHSFLWRLNYQLADRLGWGTSVQPSGGHFLRLCPPILAWSGCLTLFWQETKLFISQWELGVQRQENY